MPAQNKSKIQFYRTNKNIDNSSVSSKKLYYGEPLFVDGPNGTYLVIGSRGSDDEGLSGKTVANEKWLAFADKSVANKSVFYDSTTSKFYDSNGVEITIASTDPPLTFGPADNPIVTYNGGAAANIDSSTLSSIMGDSPTVTSPPIDTDVNSDQIATVKYVNQLLNKPEHRGYIAVTSLSGNTLTCSQWNYEYRIGSRSTAFTITLPSASNTNKYSSEIRVCFLATAAFSLTVGPTSFIINGDIDTLEIKAGNYYEISFAYLGTVTGGTYAGTYINCLVNEVPLG